MKKRRRCKTNKVLLLERLFQGHVQRLDVYVSKKAKTIKQKRAKVTVSHLQSMAHLLADELEELSRGASECWHHPDMVAGACPICEGLWLE